ncbi:MAG TPA: AMP-binding protein [Acidimicrobiales bacterium]|jgi:malonyl-CoA/methylmalonyl-CoA synthetase|nr:AMP-binding protein [Acidimicrobiales bacterium]
MTEVRGWRAHLPPGSRFGEDDLTRAGTLVRAWRSGWEGAPAAPALLDGAIKAPTVAGHRHRSGAWWTGAELEEATRRAAGRLIGAGLVRGDRLLWSTGSSVATLIVHIAALRAGLVVVPANTAYTAREIGHIVTEVRPAAAVVDDPRRGQWANEAAGGSLAVFGPELDGPDHDPGALDVVGPEEPALIVFTSGTTGVPKGAVLSHSNLLASVESVRTAWRWEPADRLVHCLPVFHAHGLCVGVYGTLLAGASAVLQPGFDPAAVFDAIEEHSATLFFGVPTMYHRLVASDRVAELGGLRLCVSGSAPLPAAMHRQVSAATGQAVLERYGMTETLMNVSNPYEGERRPGTVGFPLPGVEVTLADDDEILVRGPNVFGGYWERPEATAASFLSDPQGGRPWFRTGDLGAVSDDGYLSILGRSKELIITGGYNVYPAEVEAVLLAHPEVLDVAVTGTPSDEWGEVVTAWVVTGRDGPAPVGLTDYAATKLAPYKCPRLVHVVGELPRNALGKVVRTELRVRSE